MRKFLAATLLPLTLFTSSCACWTSAHSQEERCIVAHQVLNCAEQNVVALAPHLIPVVTWLVQGAGGTMSWDDIVKSLEAMGFQTAGCSLAQLENDFGVRTTAKTSGLTAPNPMKLSAAYSSGATALTNEQLKVAHEAFRKWMTEKHPNVKVKVKLVDGTEVLL